MPEAPAETWTTRRLLAWIADAFGKQGIESPKLCAEIVLGSVLGCERLRLYMDPDRPASTEERDRLRALVKRALGHEPVQYLVGSWSFFGIELACDRRALIPRPSTETLVEHILQHARRPDAGPVRMIADIGTGTGAIAIALAKNLPAARVVATDVSAEALALARENVERHGLGDRVELREGDLLEPIASEEGAFDVLASNPPYIPDREWAAVPPNVAAHEPTLALRGGADGLDFVRPLIDGAPRLLRPGGWLVVETAASNARAACADAQGHPELSDASVLQDHEGLDRVVVARRRQASA